MENNELSIISKAENEKSKFHYKPTFEVAEQIPVYDKDGNQTGTATRITGRILKKVWDDPEEIKKQQDEDSVRKLKAELAKIKEDIEQETFGLIRNDFPEKKARAAAIINELRRLEGKEPRKVKES